MCVEKTPWELVIDFHGHTCPGIALGFRLAQIAAKELGIRPAPDSECLVKSSTLSCAVDAFQVLNHATVGRGNLIIEEDHQHIYEFFYSGTEEILKYTVSPQVIEHLASFQSASLSPRERQNKLLETIQYIMTIAEAEFSTLERIPGQLHKA
jgi:formylmethanofuran dehydrogenase subunit E